MPSYTVTIATGNQWFAGTDDYIYITLVGTEQCSERTLLDKPLYNDFERGAVDSYSVRVEENLGDIVLVKIEKRKYWMQDDWYCRYITVKTPSGDYVEFPCFRWLVDDKEVVLRDGRAHLPQDDKTSLVKQHRQKELETRRRTYRWKEWQPGFPMSIDASRHKDLPRDIQFDSEKGVDFVLNYSKAIENLFVNQFMHMFQSSWNDFADFERIFVRITNTISEYVMQHWKEDFMFGYQFLNGCNPVVIQKCTKLPDKFPVTHEMVSVSLERELTLEQEIEAGNVYIVDYKVLDGITPNGTDPCTLQYLAAPICLLYNNTQNKILPIAIQVQWCSDVFTDIYAITLDIFRIFWKIFTHFLKVFTRIFFVIFGGFSIKRLRNYLNCLTEGFANATGGGGHVQLVQKGVKSLTFRSLCFPDMIKIRGADSKEDLPTYFYRDDGYKVWEATKSFVSDVVCIYYTSDETVQADEEIQAFVKDVCSFGMQDFDQCEFPKSVKSREELIEYLTVIVFTASSQHAAVNFGQYDWCSWIPNAPSTMRKPPPNRKGLADVNLIIESLPDRGRSSWHLGAVWALSQYQENELYLGMYPDEHFIEKPVKEAMEKFRKQLAEITSSIKKRNEGKKLPYYNMSPDKIPNSVAV
uniref:Arachidonate 5-lipoxygenase b, tandem duplicate 1 n=1 Tax=Acanthochromis polyacanthus TaxID=80966 RepID=A0A3Q1FL08_9TELE